MGLGEPREELPVFLAKVPLFEADGKAHLLQDVEVSLDLPLAAAHPCGQLISTDAESMGLQGLYQIPLPY